MFKENIKSSQIFYLSKWIFQNQLIIQQIGVEAAKAIYDI
jgi:hypothetical protein